MILGKDIHPERKIYYWGAIVIDCIRQHGIEEIPFFSLFEELRADHEISIDVYALTLDWLFLLGAIDGEKGVIKKCF